MPSIKIMTYNVCWEVFTGKNKHITNITNIINIINKRIEDNYDFICLQEISDVQWNIISQNMVLDNYKIIIKKINPAGIIILYNKTYSLVKKYSGNLINTNLDKRPYLILLFDNIILINIHMPHIKQAQSFDIIQNKLLKIKSFINKNTKFIICGDFNNTKPLSIDTFYNMLKPFGKKIYHEPKKINTCCVPNDKIYRLSYDHIFISGGKYLKYKTLPKTEMHLDMSDHIPLFAQIEI